MYTSGAEADLTTGLLCCFLKINVKDNKLRLGLNKSVTLMIKPTLSAVATANKKNESRRTHKKELDKLTCCSCGAQMPELADDPAMPNRNLLLQGCSLKHLFVYFLDHRAKEKNRKSTPFRQIPGKDLC